MAAPTNMWLSCYNGFVMMLFLHLCLSKYENKTVSVYVPIF